jgi:L-lysine 2,3-aminomutase
MMGDLGRALDLSMHTLPKSCCHSATENDNNALTALRKSGIILLNQAVLLKGINDSIETQRALCNRLVNEGVKPYYLHQLDRVEGTAHFESDESLGVAIIEQLRAEISGYAVPEFVREIAGQPSKTPIR